jgi:hypothetical protein
VTPPADKLRKKEEQHNLATAARTTTRHRYSAKPFTVAFSSSNLNAVESAGNQFLEEIKEATSCLGIVVSALLKPTDKIKPEDAVRICDDLDNLQDLQPQPPKDLFTSRVLQLRRRAMEFQRYEMLVALMKNDYDAYVATASFLSPSRIPRMQLPNVQDVLYDEKLDPKAETNQQPIEEKDGVPLVADVNYKTSSSMTVHWISCCSKYSES